MAGPKIMTVPFDAAKYLTTHESQGELLADAFASGDAATIATALGTVARARGMAAVADEAGITREGLCKALSGAGDPRLSTLMGVIKALKLEFRIVDAAPARQP